MTPCPTPLNTHVYVAPAALCMQIHGTCLGFEALAIIISRNTSILSDMDALNAPAPLLYTELAATSDWLKALPPHVVTNLQNTALAMENHAHGKREEKTGFWGERASVSQQARAWEEVEGLEHGGVYGCIPERPQAVLAACCCSWP